MSCLTVQPAATGKFTIFIGRPEAFIKKPYKDKNFWSNKKKGKILWIK